ncbi:uncharacterized protein LOC131215342 [Anopheles bellator]|uniref:uncharacterized protein LOC131215342 n=1 Tax=Anopheles bellator TaxID=139047 RepID=UPI002647F288|nr:uncharacterized protein LOC131215342 [Anopheles bellator]
MKCLVKSGLSLLGVLLLQLHAASGDFGLPVIIGGASIVDNSGAQVERTLEDITSAYGYIPTDGPVVAFNEAAIAVQAILAQVVLELEPIASTLRALATDDEGPVEPLFDNVTSNIDTTRAFLATPAQALLTTVQTEVSVYVRDELNDFLTTIDGSLSDLRGSLVTLRTGVIAARTAASANDDDYSAAQNVSPALVVDVQTKTQALRSNLTDASVIAFETERTIVMANGFVGSSNASAEATFLKELLDTGLFADYSQVVAQLTNLTTLVGTELPLVNGTLRQFAANFSQLITSLGQQYGAVQTTYGRVTAGIADNLLNAYKMLFSTAAGFIDAFVRNFYPPIEPAIMSVATTLVQRGPFADQCFDEYYALIENYLSGGEQTVESCLDDELSREKTLAEALLELIYQLSSPFEDIDQNLTVCYRLSLSDASSATGCLQELSTYSQPLPCTATKEYATLLQLLCKEVDSLRYRLWACMSRDTTDYPAQAAQIVLDAASCPTTGQ